MLGRPTVADAGTNANSDNGATKSRNDGWRITLEEALVLQGFPGDYPIRTRTRTAAFEQVGNAVPPPVAAAVVQALRVVDPANVAQ